MDNVLLMSAGGQFRHHAPIFPVHALRGCNIIKYLATAYNGRRGLVAGRFNGKDQGMHF